MGQIERVLIATDLSPRTEPLLAQIAPLLRRLRPVVDLAHVWQPQPREKLRERLQEQLAKARLTLTLHGARTGRDLLIEGDPAYQLLRLTERDGFDLIITGTRRRRLASVSAQLQRHAVCPVLTVPTDEAQAEAPLRILAASDLSGCSTLAAELAADLALELGAGLTLLHVYAPPIRVLPDGSSFAVSSATADAVAAAAEAEVAFLSRRLARPGLTITLKAVAGDPVSTILEVAVDYGLIVMGTHGRGGWKHLVLGSVAERVSRHAQIPVLTAREPEVPAQHPPIL